MFKHKACRYGLSAYVCFINTHSSSIAEDVKDVEIYGEFCKFKMFPMWETSISTTLELKGEALICCNELVLISGTNNGFDFCL